METEERRYTARSVADSAERHNPFLGAQLVVAAALALDLSLPDKLTLGPSWMLPSVEAALLVGLILATPHPRIRHSIVRRRFAISLIALVSAVNIFSLYQLCYFLLHGGKEQGRPLVLAGVVLWVTNVLLFGLWYWELDRGGPTERILSPQGRPDFLFPQMQDPRYAPEGWTPGLIDYLYVSFTNATAFSPTDAMPLTQMAKVLMSIQALAALTTVGLVVARAVNILS